MSKKKKENVVLIDLIDRKKIKIIRASKSNVTDKEISEFEDRLSTRYSRYCEFNEHCINSNAGKGSDQISKKEFDEAFQNMLEQNEMLGYMFKEQE